MNNYRMLLLMLSLFAISCAASENKYGVMISNDKTVCASFGKEIPPIGAVITLVDMGRKSQSYISAILGEKIEKCESLERAMVTGPFFNIIIDKNLDRLLFGVAVYGEYEAISKDDVVVLVTSSKESIYFRSCTSREAIHVSSWLGKPLAGKQLWRKYYYLGYDVEPSCTEQDFEKKT